jgi:hypothetical protein
MARLPRILPALLLLAACQGSDPQPLLLLTREDLASSGASMLVEGGGASQYLAYVWSNGLHVVRLDPAAPDRLQLVASESALSLAGFGFTGDLLLTWQTGGYPPQNTFWVQDLAAAGRPVRSAQLGDLTPTAGAASGRWVLVGSGTTLALLDLQTARPPLALDSHAEILTIAPVGDRFVAFTPTGWLLVVPDATAPTVTAHEDASLAGFRIVYPDGAASLVAAGPSAYLSTSRVARLDFDGALTLRYQVEVPGTFAAFAWDGLGRGVIEVDVGGAVNPVGFFADDGGKGFGLRGLALPITNTGGPTFAAHAGRLLLSDIQGIGLYVMQ